MALSTAVLKERLAKQRWTAHNIRLNDEVTTNPDIYDFLSLDDRLKATLRIFGILFPAGIEGITVADLGCLEGGFTLGMALRGAHALGIEARQTNFDKLEVLREHFALPNLQFQRADVKDFTAERFGTFDAVLAMGILYHLDHPVQWLRQITEATKRVLVLDTHYSPADQAALHRMDKTLAKLSDLETVTAGPKQYFGRWFEEYRENTDPEPNVWASYSNWRSFWLTKESLLRALRDLGWRLILEQHDYSVDIHEQLSVQRPRTLLVAVRL